MAEGDVVEVIVDNTIAVQNLTKFANVRKYEITSSQVSDHEYHVTIAPTALVDTTADSDIACDIIPLTGTVYYITTNKMGQGDERLATTLMKAFIFSITKQDVLPSKMIFANSGAFLTTTGSDSLEDLKQLESLGVEIYTCGTCLNFYQIQDQLEVGNVSNMYDIVEMMTNASKVINI